MTDDSESSDARRRHAADVAKEGVRRGGSEMKTSPKTLKCKI